MKSMKLHLQTQECRSESSSKTGWSWEELELYIPEPEPEGSLKRREEVIILEWKIFQKRSTHWPRQKKGYKRCKNAAKSALDEKTKSSSKIVEKVSSCQENRQTLVTKFRLKLGTMNFTSEQRVINTRTRKSWLNKSISQRPKRLDRKRLTRNKTREETNIRMRELKNIKKDF
jgi:hypothetical protein